MDVMNQMENALMELAFVLQIIVVLPVLQRIVQMVALVMENVMLKHTHASVDLVGLVMIVVY